MKRFVVLADAAAIALTATPALAKKSKKKYQSQQGYYAQPYAPYGWNSRNVSDPSFGHYPLGWNRPYGSRCIADLGYGRYEYCGW